MITTYARRKAAGICPGCRDGQAPAALGHAQCAQYLYDMAIRDWLYRKPAERASAEAIQEVSHAQLFP